MDSVCLLSPGTPINVYPNIGPCMAKTDSEDDSCDDAHSVSTVEDLFAEDEELSERKRHILECSDGPQQTFTIDGLIQIKAQRAVLRNEHLKLYLLAEQYGCEGQFSGIISSNLLALALQEGCTILTLQAVLDTGANASQHILLRGEGGEPVRAVYPLLYAVEKGDKEIVKTLLNAGADPLLADEKGVIPYVESLKDNQNQSVLNRLYKHAVKMHGESAVKAVTELHRRSSSVKGVVSHKLTKSSKSIKSG